MFSPQRLLRLICSAFLAALCGSFGALSEPARAQQSVDASFTVHWAVENSKPRQGDRPRDWSGAIDFGAAPIHRDIEIFHERDLGFPQAGPHVFEGDANAMDKLRRTVRAAVSARLAPDSTVAFGLLDLESWNPSWDSCINIPSNAGDKVLDQDFKDDWREYIRTRHHTLLTGLNDEKCEQIFASTFDEASQSIFLAVIEECRKARPKVKWGFYLFPPRTLDRKSVV
jgi:hypothetical protein